VVYGSNFDDILIGGSGDDLLWGFGGNDTMQGGIGNDVYIVEQAGDVVAENLNEGSDTVYAAVNFTLPANVENLFVYGGTTSAGGNALDNAIVNAYITTGVTLTGGGGNDTFAFIPGTGNGVTITDFNSGDHLQFIAYGAGATFTNIDATHSQVNYGAGLTSHDVLTFSNAAVIHAGDFFFT
jgi:Ca2+-binding RTX toxin-like protein